MRFEFNPLLLLNKQSFLSFDALVSKKYATSLAIKRPYVMQSNAFDILDNRV